MRITAVIAMMFAIAVVVIGGLPGRRVERDEAKCYIADLLEGPKRTTPAKVECVPNYVVHERAASGPELRLLAGFLALCALLIAAGRPQIAMPLILTLGLAGTAITFVVTRTIDSPFDETMKLWPYYAVRVCTAGLALATSTLLVLSAARRE